MPKNIINLKKKRKSEVIFYKEDTKEGSRFGVSYRIGDDIDDCKLEEVKTTCNTIAYREHYRAHLGKYPEVDIKVNFKMPGRLHNISFMDISSMDAYKVAELIAEYLNVVCVTPFTNPIIVTT